MLLQHRVAVVGFEKMGALEPCVSFSRARQGVDDKVCRGTFRKGVVPDERSLLAAVLSRRESRFSGPAEAYDTNALHIRKGLYYSPYSKIIRIVAFDALGGFDAQVGGSDPFAFGAQKIAS